MAREFSRTERVADHLQRELATLIQRELRDPRLGMVSVTAVKVSRDLSYARVYCTVLDCDDEAQAAPSMAVLDGAAGFLRSALARSMQLRVVPRLKFVFDTSIGRGRDMEALISRAKAADAALPGTEAGGDSVDESAGEKSGDGT